MKDTVRKVALGLLAAVLVALAVRSVWRAVQPPVVPADVRLLMDSETGALVKVRADEMTGGYPYRNPQTGKDTLYPTEICYANQCAQSGGTPVILNELLGKPGKTKCAKCGADVRAHNPGPPQKEDEKAEKQK